MNAYKMAVNTWSKTIHNCNLETGLCLSYNALENNNPVGNIKIFEYSGLNGANDLLNSLIQVCDRAWGDPNRRLLSVINY
jgi:hypothetical protein